MTKNQFLKSAESMRRSKAQSLLIGLLCLCAVLGGYQELGVMRIVDGALQSHGHLYNSVFPCFLYFVLIYFFLRNGSGRLKATWSGLTYGLIAGYVAGLASLAVVAFSSGRPWFEWRFVGSTLLVPLATLAWLLGLAVVIIYRLVVGLCIGRMGRQDDRPRL